MIYIIAALAVLLAVSLLGNLGQWYTRGVAERDEEVAAAQDDDDREHLLREAEKWQALATIWQRTAKLRLARAEKAEAALRARGERS